LYFQFALFIDKEIIDLPATPEKTVVFSAEVSSNPDENFSSPPMPA
jgi:hypothetical protein